MALFIVTLGTDCLDSIIVQREDGLKLLGKLRVIFSRQTDELVQFLTDKALNLGANIIAIKNLAAHRVDHTAVAVDNIVVLHHVLARIKVEAFHTLLGSLERAGNCLVLDWRIVIHTQAV